ncbi:MAG TPA: hypothetical protein VLA52_16555 [Thermohalobaculum sp.]|nr:hypothetical protein [Thermohalobaculum sp.]
MASAPALQDAGARVGTLRREAARASGILRAQRRRGQMRRATCTTAAAFSLLPMLALAEQPALSPGSGVAVDDAVWLFDAVCLLNHPDFQGSGKVLDDYGFSKMETAIHRQHPEKMLTTIVMAQVPGATDGARSCSVMAAGIGFSAVDARLEPLIAERLDGAERHHDPEIDLPHAVWVSLNQNLQTKIILTEHDGATVIAASVAPLPEQAQ